MIRITILVHEFVTGGGLAGQDLPRSWAAEGRAMRLALAGDFAAIEGVTVLMTLDDRLPDEPGPWSVVRIGPGDEPATFARLAAACDYTLCVAPETSGVLEQRARMIEEAGGRSLGCSPESVALCGDKLRCGAHLRTLGIATPRSVRVVPREGLPADHPYPAVLKPIDGAGSLDTYYIESPDDLPESANAMPEALLQPFETGSPMSAAFLVPERGEPRLVGVAEQHVERRAGRFAYLGGRLPMDLPILAPVVEAVRSVPGLRGWVGVDFVRCRATGRLVVLEINPRVTTSFVGWREVAPGSGSLARAWLNGSDGSGGLQSHPGRGSKSFTQRRGVAAEDAEKDGMIPLSSASSAATPRLCVKLSDPDIATVLADGLKALPADRVPKIRFWADGRIHHEMIPS